MFGERLRELRRQNKMSQEDLGKLLGLTKQSVSRYENGRPITMETVKKIADIFNVSPSTLMDEPPDWRNGVIYDDETDREFVEMAMGMKQNLSTPDLIPENKKKLHRMIDRIEEKYTDTLLKMLSGLVQNDQ